MNPKKLILLPIVSAIMLGLTRTTLPLDMLSFVAFIPLFFYFEITSNQNNSYIRLSTFYFFLHGSLFSTIYMLISQHWITLVTPGGFIGMIFIFAVVFGLMFCVVGHIYRRKPILYTLSLIFIWLCFEYMVNFTEFRFPWFNIAYGLKNSLSLLQVLEFGGVFFLSFLILLVNLLFYMALTHNRRFIIVPLSLLLVWFIGGNMRLRYVQKHSVDMDYSIALLQGNFEQDIKWQRDILDETFTTYEDMSREVSEIEPPNLIVYPEAALPVNLMHSPDYYGRLMQLVFDLQIPIYVGFPHYERKIKYRGQDSPYLYYNAANLFTPYAFHDTPYYKSILVPFGERTPLLHKFPVLWKIQMGQANFEMGEEMVKYQLDGLAFTPLICFEVAFPLYIRNAVSEHNPDFWLNLTNDAWFYRSIGTHQHAKMVVFRTIETRKPIFRVANTGYTFWTTPDGQMHDTTELFDRIAITGRLYTFDTTTPFVAYGYLIPLIFVALFTVQITHFIILSFKKKKIRKKYGKKILHNL